jgi:hypothetical protein
MYTSTDVNTDVNTDVKKVVLFIKNCLRDEDYSKELITYLFSTYDLESFIISSKGWNRLQLATHFLSHARAIHTAATNY